MDRSRSETGSWSMLNGENKTIGSVPELVEKQRDYFQSGITAKLDHRREQLLKLQKAITEGRDVLGEAVQKDLGRRSDLTYMYELASVSTEIGYVLENLQEWASPTHVQKTFLTMLDTPHIVREPKGVVLIIGPWNYPLLVVLTPLVAALAAGNTVIIKPSEVAQHTAQALHAIISKNFDPRILSVVPGGVEETTELLNQRFDHIMFTGSSTVAKIIMAAAAKNLTPCTLELGGKCPVIVEPDVDMQVTARRLIWGKLLNCGQTCLAPDYVLCTETTKQLLVDEIIKVMEEFYLKDFKNNPDYSRIINTHHFDRLTQMLSKSNGKPLYSGGESDRNELFIPPIVLDVDVEDAVMHEEIFGPILPIVTIRSFGEAIEIINKGEKPLAAYIFTRNEKKVKRFLEDTSSGSVCVNDVLVQMAVDTLPFGGVGQSGMGRYRGKFGFDEFTHEKGVLKRGFFADGIASARYPPLTEQKLAKLFQLTGVRRALPRPVSRFITVFPYIAIGFALGLLAAAGLSKMLI